MPKPDEWSASWHCSTVCRGAQELKAAIRLVPRSLNSCTSLWLCYGQLCSRKLLQVLKCRSVLTKPHHHCLCRRIMEMLVVQKLSPRTAWKLQKGVPWAAAH